MYVNILKSTEIRDGLQCVVWKNVKQLLACTKNFWDDWDDFQHIVKNLSKIQDAVTKEHFHY